MAHTDNSALLAQAARQRHQDALAAASEAIERLHRHGAAINFATVAAASGVSRSWLYTQPQIRQQIADLRSGRPATPVPNAVRASAESLRQRLDTARDEISRLRAENTALKEQLARHLGTQRARRAISQS
jgi:hypothetical protein